MKCLLAPFMAALTLLAVPVEARADSRAYGALYLHSWHLGTDALNDDTPGIAFGRRWAKKAGWEIHLEGGVFYNSYEEVSPIALGGLSRTLTGIGPGELRLGASVGVARYLEQSKYLEDAYGLPNVEGFIPIVAGTLSYRWSEIDLRVTTVPPDAGVDAIFNLSIARAF